MEKFILKITSLIALFSIAACAPIEINDIQGIQPYSYVSDHFSEKTDQSLRGSGTVRFNETSSNMQSLQAMALKAELGEDLGNSTASLIFNSSNAQLPLNNGVVVTFKRVGINVQATVSVNGNKSTVSSSRMSYIFPAALDVIVEVHNDFNRTRVLMWRRDMKIYSTATADFDSAQSGHMSPTLPIGMGGAGIYMGLHLENARVTAAQLEPAKIPEF